MKQRLTFSPLYDTFGKIDLTSQLWKRIDINADWEQACTRLVLEKKLILDRMIYWKKPLNIKAV
jgi:hypothetical protein